MVISETMTAARLHTVGGELKLANGVTLLGKSDGTFANTASVYAGSGTMRYVW